MMYFSDNWVKLREEANLYEVYEEVEYLDATKKRSVYGYRVYQDATPIGLGYNYASEAEIITLITRFYPNAIRVPGLINRPMIEVNCG